MSQDSSLNGCGATDRHLFKVGCFEKQERSYKYEFGNGTLVTPMDACNMSTATRRHNKKVIPAICKIET